jgi:hypothetical protein
MSDALSASAKMARNRLCNLFLSILTGSTTIPSYFDYLVLLSTDEGEPKMTKTDIFDRFKQNEVSLHYIKAYNSILASADSGALSPMAMLYRHLSSAFPSSTRKVAFCAPANVIAQQVVAEFMDLPQIKYKYE